MGYVRARGHGRILLDVEGLFGLRLTLAIVREIPRSRGRIALSPDVIQRAQAGDDRAWEELHRKLRPLVRKLSYQRTYVYDADLDDLEAFVWSRLWSSLPGYEHGNFISWVYSVVHSAALNWLRARRRYYRRHAEWPENLQPVASSRPDAVVVARDEVRRALDLVEREMSLTTRRTLELHAEGWSGEKIAARLGITHNSVKQRRHRALSRFPGRVANNAKNRV